ncbi:hypothetical protein PoB_000569100 [Plakobranchus ocellatus]|uniref:Uncharacterized protein n=1 Tax=Plakobranchus ocellatus TaxID=259542 RepID=A0AAV3Y7I4_9GAST|nr:hypothetical protein PoB_000569100 [Plakobranchus ocellatus]
MIRVTTSSMFILIHLYHCFRFQNFYGIVIVSEKWMELCVIAAVDQDDFIELASGGQNRLSFVTQIVCRVDSEISACSLNGGKIPCTAIGENVTDILIKTKEGVSLRRGR